MDGYNETTAKFFGFLDMLNPKYHRELVYPGFLKPSFYDADDVTRDRKGNLILEGHPLYDTSRVIAAYLTGGEEKARKMHYAIQEKSGLADVCKDGKRTDYKYESLSDLTNRIYKEISDSIEKFRK